MEREDFLKDYEDVLLPDDLMHILHTGRNTVYQYLAEGKIKSIRIAGKYRIPKRYLYDFFYDDAS